MKAKLRTWGGTNNGYLEILDEYSRQEISVRVIHKGAIDNEPFLLSLSEELVAVYEKLALPHPFDSSYLNPRDEAVTDIQALLSAIADNTSQTDMANLLIEMSRKYNSQNGTMINHAHKERTNEIDHRRV